MATLFLRNYSRNFVTLIYYFFVLGFSAFCAGLRHEPSSPPRIHIHNSSFQPDLILRVTAGRVPIDCAWRYSVVINGTIPGPELRFREGDQVWIRVYNDIPDENVTVHWHGLTQRTSPFSDGTPAASQWPIPPYHYFDYEFELQPGDAGTYYYHTHVGFGAVTAYGPLIVDERQGESPPFHYDDERTLMFADVFADNDSYIAEGLGKNPFRWSGETTNIQLNGRSRSANATANQQSVSCSYAVVSLEPNTTYRIRLIGATALSQVFVAFEGHANLTLIEVDGRYVSPVPISHLEVHTGQRYSVLLQSKLNYTLRRDRERGKTHYWIQMESRSRALITTAYAVLAYTAVGPLNNTSSPDILRSHQLSPCSSRMRHSQTMAGRPAPPVARSPLRRHFPRIGEVTRRVLVNITQITNGSLYWTQDGSPWYERMPMEPYLVSMYQHSSNVYPDYEAALLNGGLDPKTKTFPAKIGEVLEIVWQNLVGNAETRVLENHPFHAHGEHVWDVGSGYGEFSSQKLEALLAKRRKNGGPIKRDTTNLYRNSYPPQRCRSGDVVSWRAWRIRVRSPGVWMMHCHVLQHMVMGMNTVWVFGGEHDLKPLSREHAALYLGYGGRAYGNDSFDPSVVHYWHE
ncbi:L-ascorbate oxidase [Hypsibius exemplaris]|uniref:L-ascorbate oxidase n=1 Tax=Hypsibius exemplaris TaxID=2072580 RepID=A0A1W0WV89_HYPEX|nr:L-ascorbate oxidase [Hypsibius exemplaris]